MEKRLRYRDFKARGIVNNRVTLKNWIREARFSARPANRSEHPDMGRRRSPRIPSHPPDRAKGRTSRQEATRPPAQDRAGIHR